MFTSLLLLSPFGDAAQTQSHPLWQDHIVAAPFVKLQNLRVKANNARYLTIDIQQLKGLQTQLNQVHKRQIPDLAGAMFEFELKPSAVMSAELAAQYPEIMSYAGQQVGNANNYGRFSLSPKGFFGFYRMQGEWLLLSPLSNIAGQQNYIVYRYTDALPLEDDSEQNKHSRDQDFLLLEAPRLKQNTLQKSAPTGDQIRTYRLALSTTGEYSQKFGGNKAAVLEEMLTLINRINQILLNDLAIQFELVDSQNVIYTDAASDPFTNNDAASDIETNQSTLDAVLGSANYDIGHLLSTNGGGLAAVDSLCRAGNKATATSGSNNPQGERFYIDFLIHELGHQLGARHSFNALDQRICDAGQRNATSAFEPGSGSTIMSYAGLCSGQNIQTRSDPYFHAGSIAEIRNTLDSSNRQSCGVVSSANNAIPQIQLSKTNYTIPANTPFLLTGSATDADRDPLVYSWEQVNAGGLNGSTANATEMNTDNGDNPLFRSLPASSQTQRYFPELNSVITQQLSLGEVYPATQRNLNMRLTVRDTKGGVNNADVSVAVIASPHKFAFNFPISSHNWLGLSKQTLLWNVAQTNVAPINCSKVDILLSADDARDFSHMLASGVDNDGEQQIQLPNIDSNHVRLMLRCSDNIFYVLNNRDISITHSEPIQPVISGQKPITIEEDSSTTITLADLIIDDPDSIYPDDFTLLIEPGENYLLANNLLSPAENFNGQLQINLRVNDGQLDSSPFVLLINVSPVNDPPMAINDSASVAQNSSASLFDVLNNDSDIEGDVLSITAFEYSGQGTVSINSQQISYQPANGFSGSESINYTLSDGQLSAIASLNITVIAPPPPSNLSPNPPAINSSGGGSLFQLLIFIAIGLSIRGLNLRFKEHHE